MLDCTAGKSKFGESQGRVVSSPFCPCFIILKYDAYFVSSLNLHVSLKNARHGLQSPLSVWEATL